MLTKLAVALLNDVPLTSKSQTQVWARLVHSDDPFVCMLGHGYIFREAQGEQHYKYAAS